MAKQLNKAVSGGGNINFQIGLTSDTTGLNQLKTSLTELQKMKEMEHNKNIINISDVVFDETDNTNVIKIDEPIPVEEEI